MKTPKQLLKPFKTLQNEEEYKEIIAKFEQSVIEADAMGSSHLSLEIPVQYWKHVCREMKKAGYRYNATGSSTAIYSYRVEW